MVLESETMQRVVPTVLGTTLGLGLVARLLKLPPLTGFLVAGFVLHALGFRSNSTVDVIAELGITLLMFTIGLKLNLRSLATPVIGFGAAVHMGIFMTLGMCFFGAFTALDLGAFASLDWLQVVLLAFALSFSSTVFALKVLDEQGGTTSGHGGLAIGILIMQDLFAVLFLVVSAGKLPSLFTPILLLLIPARHLLGKLMASSGHGELLLVSGLFLALVVGVEGFAAVDLKPDLGALVIGILVSRHPKASELANSLWGVKELALIGFFLNIGLSQSISLEIFGTALILIMIVPLKTLLYHFVFVRFGTRTRPSALASLVLSNYSEFGLIVASFAVNFGWLEASWLVSIAIAVSLTFLVASPLNARSSVLVERYWTKLARSSPPRSSAPTKDPTNMQFLVIGLGSVGFGALESLTRQHPRGVFGVDFDPSLTSQPAPAACTLVEFDAFDPEFWNWIKGATHLQAVVLATSSSKTNGWISRRIRALKLNCTVVASSQFDDDNSDLLEAGVTKVVGVYQGAGLTLATEASSLRGCESVST